MKTRRLGRLAVSIAVLAIPATAQAAPGDIVGQSCISATGAGGCAVLPQPNMLESATAVVIAPRDPDVYVSAGAGIAHFRSTADGTLLYVNCVDVSSAPSDRCPTAAAPPDAGGALSLNSISLAMAPDGRHVYAVSWADALLWWARDPVSGDLTWGGCRDAADDAATNGRCGTATTFAGGNFPAGALDFSQGIAVTPDGETIYIADQSQGLLQAQRNATTGAATPTACFTTMGDAVPGCAETASGTPMALSAIDVASNSRDVYMRSISPGGITHFTRSAGGVTAFASCVAAVSPSAACATAAPSPIFLNAGSLGVAGDVLVTHGGTNAGPSGTVARFARNADGTLAFERCATTEAAAGPCAALPAQTTGSSIGKLTVSADASSVYLPPGIGERALMRVTGALAFASCLSDTGVAGCLPPPLPVPFAAARGQMALSPDGRRLYQAGSDTLNIFDLEQLPAVPPPGGGGGGGGGGEPALPPVVDDRPRRATAPRIRSVKRRAKGRYRVAVRVFEAGTLSARFTGRLKRTAKVRRLGKPARKRVTRPGIHRIVVRPSARARKRKVRAKLVVRIAPPGLVRAQATRTVKLR